MKGKKIIFSSAVIATLFNSTAIYATQPAVALPTEVPPTDTTPVDATQAEVAPTEPVPQETTEQQQTIQTQEQMIQSYQTELDKKLAQISWLEEQSKLLQGEIDNLRKSVTEKEEKIVKIEELIRQKEIEIEQLKIDLEEAKIIVARNLKIMEQKGDMTFLEYVLASKSFSEIFSRYQVLNIVQEEHNAKMQELQDLTATLTEEKRIIDVEKRRVESEKTALNITQIEVQGKQNQLNAQKTQIDAEYQQVEGSISQSKEVIRQMIQEIQDIEEQNRIAKVKYLQEEEAKKQAQRQSMENYYISEIVGTDVVDIAYQWVYQRGLGSPNPVIYSMPRRQLTLQTYGDCSAFTRRVYMDAGYGHIGYTTADQIANPAGSFIESVADLQPGDLMYFGPTGGHVVYSYLPDGRKVATAHVAIYIGDNKMIDLASGVGTISIKDFSEGSQWEWYVKNRWVGGKRFYK